MKTQDKYVLITNVCHVSIGGVRTDTHALLLEEWLDLLDGRSLRRRVRGFGTVAEWPVFDVNIPSIEHKLTNAEGKNIISVGNGGEPHPLVSGAVLQLDGGPRLELSVADQDKPIDVLPFAPGTDIQEVWKELPRKVAQYWWPAYSYMPLLTWVSSGVVRALRDGEKGSGA